MTGMASGGKKSLPFIRKSFDMEQLKYDNCMAT